MKLLDKLKKENEAPSWMNQEGYDNISNGGYLLPQETPREMYMRVARTAAKHYKDWSYWQDRFFDAMWKNWLCPASPVLSNMGTTRGLPISCYSIHVGDSVDSIFTKNHELAMLSKYGGGVGVYLGDIRGRGTAITGNGVSEGIVPWSKVYDTTTGATNQGSVRRGASALYLPIEHIDIDEFINIRRPVGDTNSRCMNTNHGISITDNWMNSLLSGDKNKRHLWEEILTARVETGEPYLFFKDNVNNQSPECYKANKLEVVTSNICTEIDLFTDPNHSFVCCLSSLNLVKWNEWKDTDLINVTVRFLDGVMEEYIQRSEGLPGFECSRRSAIKGRAIGIGVLGWHTLLQATNINFDSFDAMQLNAEIFKNLRAKAEDETKKLAIELGEPEWCRGFGRRNTHLLAIAPTVSNSAISGGYSAGIEPLAANIFSLKSAKGTFIRKNAILEKILQSLNKDLPEVWQQINEQSGSVQDIKFLSDELKQIFLTAREINQYAIIRQAAQRQRWIDQGQSVNLFFGANSDPKYIHGVHIEAWQSGLKSLYYLRTEGVIKGDMAFRSSTECTACEG